jgi:predicted dehydrogenase
VQKRLQKHENIFLEKPIARNTEEAEEIIASTRKNSVKLMIGYPLRFNAAFHELKKEMEKGILGDIEIAYATFISSGPFFHRAESHTPIPVPEWWFKKELTGGGALIDLGSHIINLLRWYFGEITDIKSHFRYRFNLDFEDTAICMAKFENGITGIINVGWFMQGHQLKVELYGTADHAYAKHPSGNRVITATQMLTTGIYNFYRPHFNELQYFVNCIIKDKTPIPSGEDGLKDLEAIEKAYKNQIRLE